MTDDRGVDAAIDRFLSVAGDTVIDRAVVVEKLRSMAADSGMDVSVFLKMLSAAFDPEVVRCMNAIRATADYDIPESKAACFLRFHAFITSPQPKYITAWRDDPSLEKRWYHSHVNGVLGDVRGALAAAHYHAGRLGALETSVAAILDTSSVREPLANATVAIGSTRKLDFEYQAFVLAYRRCLDYLALALACYFKIEASSFRTFPKSIAKTRMPKVAAALTQAHMRHVTPLAFVLAEGRKSVRHRIAHYEFVSAGCINLSARGFVLAGGGEEFSARAKTIGTALTDALSARLSCLHACIDDMIDSFISAARESAALS